MGPSSRSEAQKEAGKWLANQYAWTHGDSQTRADFLAGYDAGFRRAPAEPAVQGEPTDAQVEAACRSFGGITAVSWDDAADWEREDMREYMRNALRAAFAARGADDEQ